MDEIGALGPGLWKGPARAIACLFLNLSEGLQEGDKVVLVLLREVQVAILRPVAQRPALPRFAAEGRSGRRWT
jgi:hypothetical protein